MKNKIANFSPRGTPFLDTMEALDISKVEGPLQNQNLILANWNINCFNELDSLQC